MEFSKYEATGNDFIAVDATAGDPGLEPGTVRDICDRHTGVGADGVLMLLPSASADLRMRIFNADGTEAEMCGNGLRAITLFAFDSGYLEGAPGCGRAVLVETAAGARTVTCLGPAGGAFNFDVEMGRPAFTRGAIPMNGPPGEEAVRVPVLVPGWEVLECTCVSMGNPHCVLFVEDAGSFPVASLGPALENSELFPERTNVEFVEHVGEAALKVRVWERGVGETQACGTGACAALVAARLTGRTGADATVSLPGGDLEIRWDGDVFMKGPARMVFKGRIEAGR